MLISALLQSGNCERRCDTPPRVCVRSSPSPQPSICWPTPSPSAAYSSPTITPVRTSTSPPRLRLPAHEEAPGHPHRRQFTPPLARGPRRRGHAPLGQPAATTDPRGRRARTRRPRGGADLGGAPDPAGPAGSAATRPVRPDRLERTLYQQVLIGSPQARRGLLFLRARAVLPIHPRTTTVAVGYRRLPPHEQCRSLHARTPDLRTPADHREPRPGTEHHGRQHPRSCGSVNPSPTPAAASGRNSKAPTRANCRPHAPNGS